MKNVPKHTYIKNIDPSLIYAYGNATEPVTWSVYLTPQGDLIYVADGSSEIESIWPKLGQVYFDDPDIAAPMQMYVSRETLERKYPHVPFIINEYISKE